MFCSMLSALYKNEFQSQLNISFCFIFWSELCITFFYVMFYISVMFETILHADNFLGL